MLLKNYYTCSTATEVSTTDSLIYNEESKELSPRFSKSIVGDLHAVNKYAMPLRGIDFFHYGKYNRSQNSSGNGNAGSGCWFGNSTIEPTFDDYTVSGDYSTPLTKVYKGLEGSYDGSTKTYTVVASYTLTNPTSNQLVINEIALGFTPSYGSGVGSYLITRDLLGSEAFTIEANESVNFELTIKYTIAEPLR